MALSMTDLGATTEADALARLLDGGKLKIYSSTVPATADTALVAQVLLATLTFNATSAPGASNGVLTFNAIVSATAVATATATFYRATKTDDTVVLQGSVGTSGENLNLNSTAIQTGATVSVSSMSHTVTK